MKRRKYLSLYIVTVVAIFVAIMAYVRFDNSREVRRSFYLHWQRYYVVEMKSDEKYVNTTPHTDKKVALSEGQGYGMYIAALAAERKWGHQKDFEQLNNFYLKHRDTVNKKKTMLMSWRAIEKKGKWSIDKNSATDGDLFIAQALLLASKQWKNKKYKNEATALLADILHYEYNARTKTLTVGDWANSKSKYYNLMRTSDVMPEFFDNFYQATGDGRWLIIKKTMLKRLNELSHLHKSGLVPDFA
ncbi:glycosyl hydrolase family 8 [Lactobacillus ultunensis DSM 16047]|uniref:Glucanase n=1 Tax=Lactobacillus ultunensis DSM 16047 TaxID=525365 RepID=C2EQ52_9LACO|nr:glycosyl hydrolase family 8 [Lactobacillus ultunensis DSM 16047]